MLELFEPIVSPDRLHPNFVNIMNEQEPYARDVINSWADGFIDRDGKFVIEFQTTFNSSFWELYLFGAMKSLGFITDFSFARPDFVVSAGSFRFCVEASIAQHAQGSLPEWERGTVIDDLRNLDRQDVVDAATIRLAGTLKSKYEKYLAQYSKLEHVRDRPFIIAIAPFEQPFFFVQNDTAIHRVLYAFEKYLYHDYPEENRRDIYGIQNIQWIRNSNGAKVPLGSFVNGCMPEISAVVFSNVATFGKVRALSADPGHILFEFLRYNAEALKAIHGMLPKAEYVESVLDGLHVFHNPQATFPLDESLFDHPDVTHHWCVNGGPTARAKDGALFHRSVIKLGVPKDG